VAKTPDKNHLLKGGRGEEMSKKLVIVLVIAVAGMFFAGGIYAKVADVINLQEKSCPPSSKPVVEFNHKAHSDEYIKKYAKAFPNGCGQCHHDAKHKPIAGLTADSKVQHCIECHKQCGEAPKGKDAPKLDKAGKLQYLAEAYHDDCRTCHRDFNKEFNPAKKAPVTCNDCHKKS
jgi:hypothetical protein